MPAVAIPSRNAATGGNWSWDPINSYQQGSNGGSYTVRAGDTLGSIAAQLWGDSSLWYKLGEANGIAGAGALNEGQVLIVPSGWPESSRSRRSS